MARTNIDEADKKAREATDSYIQLEREGDKVRGVFLLKDDKGQDLIDAEETVWNPKLEKSETYDPKLHSGMNVSTRFKFNFFVHQEGNGQNLIVTNRNKLLTLNAKWWKIARSQMEKACPKREGLEGQMFEIEMMGSKKKPVYMVSADRKVSDVPGLVDFIKNAKLFDFTSNGAAHTNGTAQQQNQAAAQAAQPETAPGCITFEKAQGLLTRMKKLPDAREQLNRFQVKFGIEKIRELKQEQLAAAEAWLDELEKPAAAPAPQAFKDPWANQ